MKIPGKSVVHIGREKFVGEVPDDKAKSVGLTFPKASKPDDVSDMESSAEPKAKK